MRLTIAAIKKEPDVKNANRAIDAVAKTVGEILEKKKYSIDYYQREYKWQSKQLSDLVGLLHA